MRPFEIIVCIKPVPDPKHWQGLKLDEEKKTLRREGVPSVINPLDKNALEEGIKIKEHWGGRVIVLSMAPPSGRAMLQEALAMGADQGIFPMIP